MKWILRVLIANALLALMASIAGAATPSTATNASSLPAPTAAASPKDYTLGWGVELKGDYSKDTLNNQRTEFLMAYRLVFDMKLNSWMSVNLTPEMIAQTGYIQSPNAVDPQTSRININNASLDLLPVQYLKLSAGSLNEGSDGGFHTRLFMYDEISFPAARLIVQNTEKGPWKLFGFVEGAIPTSSSISNNSNDYNSTPSLETAGLGLKLGSKHLGFESRTQVNYYQFQNLPQSIMTASALRGNSGIATVGSDYDLRYAYAGVEAFTNDRWQFAKHWEIMESLTGIQNSQAPAGSNQGYAIRSAIGYEWSRNLEIIPTYTFFNIQRDATVAAYNYELYSTNTAGYRGELYLKMMRKYHIGVGYTERVPLIEMPSQPAEQIYQLKFKSADLSF